MQTNDEQLLRCMEGMADGDSAFFFTFYERFGPKVAWLVREMVRSMGRLDILHDDDEIDGLVQDACSVIFDRAGAWQAGGALPWNWARQAIWAEVIRGVGNRRADSLECERILAGESNPRGFTFNGMSVDGEADGSGAGADDLTIDDVSMLIESDPRARLLDDALRSEASERNRMICWQYGIQKVMGDPSPAVTVGRMFGLKPSTVRQIFRRNRVKVIDLIESDERFESLREIDWLAA